MLFVLFQLGKDRYALEAGRVVEIVPLLTLDRLPNAPKGVTGVFNYRGRPVPAVDLSELTLGQPASVRLSTRIIIMNYPDPSGRSHLVGLVAENATQMLRTEAREFREAGASIGSAPYLGPVLMDAGGPVQWLQTDRLLSGPVGELLFSEPARLAE